MNPIFRYSLLASALACLCTATAHATPGKTCAVPGAPVDWQIAYCEYEEGTDDFEAPGVDECIHKQPHYYNNDKKLGCDDSIRYKMEICKILTNEGYYKTVNTCFNDKKLMPDNVKNGGVD